MPRKRHLLDARSHLEHVQLVLDGLDRYGLCPMVRDELKMLAFINRQILARAAKRAAKGDRKDIYISPSTQGY